ncbi:hypothetical protein MCHIJ_13800 [Mycolicibacterium chitae]|nr:hypothetical protein MCHIJ_13800 [Mycolicibacterium chitae]
MGSASGTSISATHSGSTSGGYNVHFMLVRCRNCSMVSCSRGFATLGLGVIVATLAPLRGSVVVAAFMVSGWLRTSICPPLSDRFCGLSLRGGQFGGRSGPGKPVGSD